MSLSKALIVLLARRHGLYEQLRLIDRRVAEAQNSPFFRTRAGNAATMNGLIEGVEGQIADINRQLEDIRGRIADGELAIGPL